METMCIDCKERPIHVKKRKLCQKCYQRWLKTHKGKDILSSCKSVSFYKMVQHSCEVEFVKNYFTHKEWIHQPAFFRVGKFRYTPDFYDNRRGVFIEVVGTRQAFSQNRDKYKKFMELFASVKFEIRCENGDLVDIDDERQHWSGKI